MSQDVLQSGVQGDICVESGMIFTAIFVVLKIFLLIFFAVSKTCCNFALNLSANDFLRWKIQENF